MRCMDPVNVNLQETKLLPVSAMAGSGSKASSMCFTDDRCSFKHI